VVASELLEQTPSGTEAILGGIHIDLPEDKNRGMGGFLWMFVALVPLSIGAGLIRPSLNSLMTKRVDKHEYGSILGTSSALVSAANAAAPLIGGLIFQQQGSTAPFLIGGVLMALLWIISLTILRSNDLYTESVIL
jgi:MFS family permease